MKTRCLFLALAVSSATSPAIAHCNDPHDAHVEIYPTAKVLPENLLRMYVYFPRRMGVTAGLDSVRLLDEDQKPIPGVFLKNRDDLWSPDRRRLTVYLDPGRVKTGLVSNDAMGRALIAGHSYTFEVSGAMLDATGCSLGADTHHSFLVKSADIDPPDPGRWTLTKPKAGSLEPLIVKLGSPHDHLSLAYRVRVTNTDGAIQPGAIDLGANEETWAFKPRNPWKTENYTLLIDKALEDLAGNRPGILFDQPPDKERTPAIDRLHFAPQP